MPASAFPSLGKGWLLAAALIAAGAKPCPAAEATPLRANQPVERALRGGEQHTYSIALGAAQYLEAFLDPQGVAVRLKLLSPDGQKLFEEYVAIGAAPNPLEWVAEQGGEYQLEVRSSSPETKQGRYRLEARALREAQAVDRTRVAARLALEEGQTLVQSAQAEPGVQKLERAVALIRESKGDAALEGRALNWLGYAYAMRRDYPRAQEALDKALELRRDLGPFPKADSLLAQAFLARARRNLQAALPYCLEAIALFRQVGARVHEARGFQNLGVIYNDLGDYRNALKTYGSQASIWEEEGLFEDQAQMLSSMGRLHWRLGEAEEALAIHRRAEEVARREKLGRKLADAWTDIGLTYRLLAESAPPAKKRGHYDDSLRYLKQALDEQVRLKSEAGQRVTLRGLRRTYESLGDWDTAVAYSARILDLPGGADIPEFTALGRIALRRGELDEARDWIEEALASAESARPRVSDYDLQASYEGSVNSLFDLYVDVLMRLHARAPQAGLDWAAFQASERGRARALIDNLPASQGRGAGAAPAGLAPREKELGQAAEDLRARIAQQAPDGAERIRLEADLLRTLAEREAVRRRGRRQDALKRVAPPTLAEIQALLDDESLLLEYDLGQDHSYLFAIGKRSWATFELPAEREIARRARLLPALLSERARPDLSGSAQAILGRRREADRRFEREAPLLSELILGPVRPPASVKRLILVWDGALHYVPAAGLPVPRAWQDARARGPGPAPALVSRYEIVTLPSATLVAALESSRAGRERPRKRVAVFADPVFDARDARVHGAGGAAAAAPLEGTGLGLGPVRLATMGVSVSRLPHTATLAAEVLKSVPAGEGLAALGFAATREAALAPDLADYAAVVFATHAYFDEDFPALSGIVLSQVDENGKPRPGILRQHDVYGMSLNADLVVLAGCETGLGKETRGEGLLGLSRGFFYAGASRVVASLWRVEEAATMKLITDFLRRTHEGQPYAAALRQAQLAVAADPRWRAPYFWAGFVLQGDWR